MKFPIREMQNRLKTDFQLSIISILGAFAFVSVSPFAVYRLMQGQFMVFILDLLVVLFACSIVSYAWISGNSMRAALVLATSTSVGIAVSAQVNPLATPYWGYCAVLFNFALVRPNQALLLISSVFISVLVKEESFVSNEARTTFTVTILATTLFAYIFSERNDYQRKKLLELTRTDPLTGSANRRAFDEELDSAVRATRRHDQPPISMAFLDIDHFKLINDELGHEKGDLVLISIVQLIARSTRPRDRLFRIGGEEFCLLMEQTDKPGAIANSQRLCRLIRDTALLDDRKVTVSIGVSESNAHDSVESWQKRCDQALYSAKTQGRNRVIYFDPPEESASA